MPPPCLFSLSSNRQDASNKLMAFINAVNAQRGRRLQTLRLTLSSPWP